LILAAADSSGLAGALTVTLNILKVVIGLGLVIFVHELGHFLVAKLSGVKCDKFYLGFDIFGVKLWKHVWGETEYGIGILPLGGYVKMLGQEDNPARLREEIERAKARQSSDAPSPAGEQSEPSAINVEEAERVLYDPRSYLAQSVPKRMAIISAGVIMNVLFAGLCAIAAYGLGVRWIPPEVGGLFSGQGAWRAGLQVGDRIERAAGKPIERFTEIRETVSVGDIENGVALVVKRPGVKEPLNIRVMPDRIHNFPTLGITGPLSTVLDAKGPPAIPLAAAGRANPPFESGDKIVAVAGQPVQAYYQILHVLAAQPEKPLEFTVERTVKEGAGKKEETRQLKVSVPPQAVRYLGLVMTMGPITAVQEGSPAAKAGLKPGDVLLQIDGEAVGDPLRLPERLRQQSEKEDRRITLTVLRGGAEQKIAATLRKVDWYEEPIMTGDPLSSPQLGIAYQIDNRVAEVERQSPAAKAGVPQGAVIVRAKLIPPDAETIRQNKLEEAAKLTGSSTVTLEFDHQDPKNWPSFFYALQMLLPGGHVELELADGHTYKLEPAEAGNWYNPDRGLRFTQDEFIRQATSVGDAVSLGTQETANAMTFIFRLLGKLGSQVSPKSFGGPISIAVMAYQAADEGLADLLMFLTLIGANLAVINFLPIPVLDGGHMVFLAYEGLRGKPPSERVQLTLTYMGLLFILGLMIFVFGLDISRLLPW
jgi:regulator of sigma E protease